MNCVRFRHVIFPRWQVIQRGLTAKPEEGLSHKPKEELAPEPKDEFTPEPKEELVPKPKKKFVKMPNKVLAPKFNFHLDEKVSEAIKSDSVKPRRHVGVMKTSVVSLPDEVMKAAPHILEDYPEKALEADARILSKYIWSRHPPLEGLEYSEKLEQATYFVMERETTDPNSPEISDEERKHLLNIQKAKIKKRTNMTAYHWKAINFDSYYSAMYLVSRMSPDFAALVKVLSEIKKRDADFAPVTLTDFGSGVGTSMWAVHRIWPRICKEIVCVDSSPHMNTLADRLLRGGSMDGNQCIQPGGIFFKQFLPSSQVLKYDLVIASRSLFELPNIESRVRTLDILWRKTLGYLVIIEAGTNAGYKLVLEARDYILQLGQESQDASDLQGHVFSPCAHEKFCPRYFGQKMIPCNFEVSYKPFTFSKEKASMKERYSYVVLKKGPVSEEERYPRIVQEPMIRKGHIICDLCTKFGTLSRVTATKKKHSKECYRVLKYSNWGDLLPVVLPEPEDKVSAPAHAGDDTELVSSNEEFDLLPETEDKVLAPSHAGDDTELVSSNEELETKS